MGEDEKLTRHNAMLEAVTSHTSHNWAATIVKQLLENVGGDNMAHQTPKLDTSELKAKYDGAQKRLMLFDYDVSSFLSRLRCSCPRSVVILT